MLTRNKNTLNWKTKISQAPLSLFLFLSFCLNWKTESLQSPVFLSLSIYLSLSLSFRKVELENGKFAVA